MFGGSADVSGSPVLTAFLRGLRKRFQRCTVLKLLAKTCPIRSNKRRKHGNDPLEHISSNSSDSDRGRGSSAPCPRALGPLEAEVPVKSVELPDVVSEVNHAGRVADSTATKTRGGELVTGDFGTKNEPKEGVIFKKTKRGCRAGKRKHDVRSASSSSSCFKKQKTKNGCTLNSVQGNASHAVAAMASFLPAPVATAMSSNRGHGAAAGTVDLLPRHNSSSLQCEGNLARDPLVGVETSATNGTGLGPTIRPGPDSDYGHGHGHGDGDRPPGCFPQRAAALHMALETVSAPRTGTVGDRLLARMRSNVFRDITLTHTRRKSSAAGPQPAECTSRGGYISQDENVKRSRGVSRALSHRTSAVTSEVQREGRNIGIDSKATAVRGGLHSNLKSNFSIGAAVNRFQYWAESSSSPRGEEEEEEAEVDEADGDFLGVFEGAGSGVPVLPVTSEDITARHHHPCNASASDNNCTDVTESVSSLLVSEGINATTRRDLDSGLALHVTYRTLRTEVGAELFSLI